MAHRIKLKRYEVKHTNYNFHGAYRLRVEAVNPEGFDGYVFLFRRDLANPYTGEVKDRFFAVASPVDIAEYPVGAPDPSKAYPIFRWNAVELDIRSTDLAKDAWLIIVQECCGLVAALDRLRNLELAEEVQCGILPGDESDSSPGSESLSESQSLSESASV